MTETLPEIHTGLFIAGERQEAADSFAVHDPADPESVVGYAGAASEEQARAAVAAAHDAFPAWAALDPHERAARVKASLGALAADNDERVELLSRENGKVRSECEIEMHVIEAPLRARRRARRRRRRRRASCPRRRTAPRSRTCRSAWSA